MSKALLGASERVAAVRGPLRRAAAQMPDQLTQGARRERRIFADGHVHQRVHPCAHGARVERQCDRIRAFRGIARGVHPSAPFTARHAQQSAVVHDVEQFGAGVRRSAEPVGHFAVREMRVHLARVHGAACADEFQHRCCLRGTRRRPHRSRRSWVHQLMMGPRHISIIHKEVFFQRQFRVAALEVARPIARHTVAQSQVLSAGRSTDRIGLHEPQLVDRPLEGGGLEQRSRDGVTAQMIQRDPHAEMIFRARQR